MSIGRRRDDQALNALQGELEATFEREQSRLEGSDVWQKVAAEQREQLVQRFNLQKPPPIKVANEDEIDAELRHLIAVIGSS